MSLGDLGVDDMERLLVLRPMWLMATIHTPWFRYHHSVDKAIQIMDSEILKSTLEEKAKYPYQSYQDCQRSARGRPLPQRPQELRCRAERQPHTLAYYMRAYIYYAYMSKSWWMGNRVG